MEKPGLIRTGHSATDTSQTLAGEAAGNEEWQTISGLPFKLNAQIQS
ncbi:hypothetical protein NC99_30750 [Sunxiuqinia dokdonensis]|uniref:Uncharacterized protein n=1 Tax=Sunxiuqinia dokdonensis TaxID=1409788 RepID=A0A0L8V798_9BACT|nr:hypothetical protein NC99_30750 [Sunxiuqinia dokdonensis]